MTYLQQRFIACLILISVIATSFAPIKTTHVYAEDITEEVTSEVSAEVKEEVDVEELAAEEEVIEQEEVIEESTIPETPQNESYSETFSTTEEIQTLETTNGTSTSEEVAAELSYAAMTVEHVATSGPEIVSGEAIALANVLNIVNTNLVNSSGEVIFSNVLEDQIGGIDFRNGGGNGTACEFLSCEQVTDVEVHLVNDAFIENAIVVEASSGDNLIEDVSASSSASITTGNAYAGLNLVNIANTNFINSNYLLVTMNAFKDVSGDIIFPSLQNFFGAQSLQSTAQTTALLNTADISNSLTMSAETGENSTSGSALSVTTGDSFSLANVFNQLNTTLSGGDSISILLRVHGTWLGELFGMIPGMSVTEGPDGSYYIGSGSQFGSRASDALVAATNTARISNTVRVGATTGNNEISSAHTGLISTGDAYAGANVVNIANATVIGRNWILAVINIFGDFNGNLSFGQPDVWVGEQVAVPAVVTNDSELTYTFTVINKGDAPATEIILEDVYDASHIEIISSNLPYTHNENNRVLWQLGSLGAGEATEVTYVARVVNTTPNTDITNVVSVIERETDANLSDNTDTGTVRTGSSNNSSGGRQDKNSRKETVDTNVNQSILDIQIKRPSLSSTVTTPQEESIQELIVINPTDTVMKSVTLNDVLTDAQGIIIKNEIWDIGDLLPHEEVTITYAIRFSENAASGQYGLSTRVSQEGVSDIVYSNNGTIFYLPYQTVANIENSLPPQSRVLGITSTHSEDKRTMSNESAGIGQWLREWLSPAIAYASLNADETSHNYRHSFLIGLNLLLGLLVLLTLSFWYKRYYTKSLKRN